MDPRQIAAQQEQQWLQTPTGQSFAQTNGYGTNSTSGSNSQYANYIMSLIQANPQNPDYQQKLMGYYLDATNPTTADTSTNNNVQTALSMMSSDDPTTAAAGVKMLQLVSPQAAAGYTSANSTNTSVNGYYDAIRKAAAAKLSTDTTKEDYAWDSYLANASNSQIDAYQKDPSLSQQFAGSNLLRNMGIGAAGGAAAGSIIPGVGTIVGGLGGALGGVVTSAFGQGNVNENLKRQAAGYSGYTQ